MNEEFEEFDTETVVNIARACMNDAIDYFLDYLL